MGQDFLDWESGLSRGNSRGLLPAPSLLLLVGVWEDGKREASPPLVWRYLQLYVSLHPQGP